MNWFNVVKANRNRLRGTQVGGILKQLTAEWVQAHAIVGKGYRLLEIRTALRQPFSDWIKDTLMGHIEEDRFKNQVANLNTNSMIKDQRWKWDNIIINELYKHQFVQGTYGEYTKVV